MVYGKCEESDILSWVGEKNIIKLVNRKTPLNISAMCKELWEAYNG